LSFRVVELTDASNERHGCEVFQIGIEGGEKSLGGVQIVFADVDEYMKDVTLGFAVLDDPWH
jgi:hypothetical protein